MSADDRIAALFSSIAPAYDGLNRLFSLASDLRWRRTLARLAATVPGARVIDVCTGTADLAVELVRSGAAKQVVGLDLSVGMLRRGHRKVGKAALAHAVTLLRADALSLPFPDGSFDAACSAFGLRNIRDRARAVGEMARVTRAGGKVLVLEFAPPRRGAGLALYSAYLRRVIPFVGGIVSGRPDAYRHLRDSIASFLDPGEMTALLRASGLEGVRAVRLTAGIAYLYRARKPGGRP